MNGDHNNFLFVCFEFVVDVVVVDTPHSYSSNQADVALGSSLYLSCYWDWASPSVEEGFDDDDGKG